MNTKAIKLEIQSVFLNPLSHDALIWEPSNDGKYSAKSAYNWLTHIPLDASSTSWSWIWKFKLPENVKHFVWLVMHNGLSTNEFRVRHHVSSDASCQRCGYPVKSILHALCDCPRVRRIWQLMGFQYLNQVIMTDPGEWLKHHALKEKGCLFVICCWMWKSRNAEVFSDLSMGPMENR